MHRCYSTKKLDNVEYCNVSLTKKDMVITLANLQQGVNVSGQSIVMDDDRLFNRPPPVEPFRAILRI